MTKPLPWSPSSLETFVNCGEQYYHKYVAKDLPPEVRTVEQTYGEEVHKHFEARQCVQTPLPKSLETHEPFMKRLESLPGWFVTEQKVALTKPPEIMPVSWAWRKEEIWYRGVIDYLRVDPENKRAWIVDYKTGKPHQKFRQLISYALYTFIMYPYVDQIDVRFYWTRDGTNTRKVWARYETEMLWGEIIGDLKQYKEAFKTDTWQKRPSGLCNGWCPVTTCEHWKPKRS